MAGNIPLSRRDIDILGKIRDPESNPATALRLDASLPRDPHITDESEYARLVAKERALVLAMQQAEMELAGMKVKSLSDPVAAFRTAVVDLGTLIDEHPNYASARNNRAQALRRLYGDDALVEWSDAARGTADSSKPDPKHPETLLQGNATDADERARGATTLLSDLDRAIALLMPPNPSSATMSPTAAKTLSLALTQRAAFYYATSKQLASGWQCVAYIDRPESRWSRMEFEDAASRDFTMGGHFGNDIARGLAVGTNPTAKLCGQMVQQMMKNEYGLGGQEY